VADELADPSRLAAVMCRVVERAVADSAAPLYMRRRAHRLSRLRTRHTETGDSGGPNGSMNSVTGPAVVEYRSLENVEGVGKVAGDELGLLEHDHEVLGHVSARFEK
jgi:hypothetical protein